MVIGVFSFREIKTKRDAYIKRLNGIYERNLDKVIPLHAGYNNSLLID